MMMSIFRQGRNRYELDVTNCISAAMSEADLELIGLTMRTGHPVLIGLDNDDAIIKPTEDSDDRLSFAVLYDKCYTQSDLQRMQRRGVKDPAEALQDTFRIDLMFQIDGVFGVAVKLRADHAGDARRRFTELFKSDVMLREAIYDEVLRVARGHADFAYRVRESSNDGVDDLEPGLTFKVTSSEDEC